MITRVACSSKGLVLSALLFISLGAGCTKESPLSGGQDSGSTASSLAGGRVFDESLVHQVELELAAEDWQSIIDEAAAYVNDNSEYPYFHARARFDGEELRSDVGLRLKGHISIQLAEGHGFPLKLDFNRYVAGTTLDGLKKLNLHTNFNGPTLPILRDYLSYEAWRQYGVAASRTSFAEVTVNGEALGVYVLVEQVDGGFIERHFSRPYGDLYKPEQATGSLEYRGSNIADYPDIGHQWPEGTDHAALLNALEVLRSGSLEEIAGVFDVEGVLTYMAGNVALGSGDYYPNTGHNYYLYEATPGRFTMLPWDMNGSQERDDLSVCSPTVGYLSGKLLQDPGNMERYRAILDSFLADTGSEGWLMARLDAAQSLLGPSLPADKVEGIREAIIARVQRLQDELAAPTPCP
ncbi:MAG: CotH kinase family protein [Candidatus Eisenbacteria bacterium]|uniref:CotH kinase family protein n=1 Tax=Eiseniibacteriota bacterium TaxID=2212470 RepID=A0A948RY00_UNCEI|nr:CotH kinase family protein [Candidatus Eisenbacteria bacterium]MBU1951273.1 CotH kinase family protein [Candidatus Eisenbacteria bacterium]MBU2691152.1 CotH kinase family protein [Candidatus Eisenbacteria bacterium]